METLYKCILIKETGSIEAIYFSIEPSRTDGIGGGYSSASETEPGRFTINLFRPREV